MRNPEMESSRNIASGTNLNTTEAQIQVFQLKYDPRAWKLEGYWAEKLMKVSEKLPQISGMMKKKDNNKLPVCSTGAVKCWIKKELNQI